MPAKSKGSRKRRGRPAPNRLADDLQRHQLARSVAPEVIERIDEFLDYSPRLARRRTADHIGARLTLAADVLSWAALVQPRDERRLTARCLAAACFVNSDPHGLPFVTLALSELLDEIATYVRAAVVQVEAEAEEAPAIEVPGGIDGELRTLRQRLQSGEAKGEDGLRVARMLVAAALALDLEQPDSVSLAHLSVIGAFWLLERRLPDLAADTGPELAGLFEGMAEALPDIVAHAESHLDDEEVEEEPDLDGDDEDELPDLDELVLLAETRLRTTEDPGVAADIAYRLGLAMLVSSMSFEDLPAGPSLDRRIACAACAILAEPAADDPAASEALLLQAAALLDAMTGPAAEPEPVERRLTALDALVDALDELADSDIVDEPAGALALLTAVTQLLQAGVELGHPDADKQVGMAAALGLLDPLATVGLPEARAQGAARLRELAEAFRAVTSR